MLRKYCLLTFSMVLLSLMKLNAQPDNRILTPEEMASDFRLMREALEQIHPGIYRFVTETEFDSVFDNAEQSLISPMPVNEFYKRTMPVIARIKCGHTKYIPEPFTSYNYYFNTDRLFPLKLFFTDTSAFVLGGFNNDFHALSGSEIVTLNGQSMNQIRIHLFQYMATDGNVQSAKYSELNDYFSAYYANFIGASDTFRIRVKLTTGEIADTCLFSIPIEEISEEDLNPENRFLIPYEVKFSGETAILTIASFAEQSKDISYKAFLKKSFKAIEERGCKTVIIDLRNNEGGNDRRGARLLSYLVSEPFPYYKKLTLTSNKKYTCEKEVKLPAFIGILRVLVKKKGGEYLWTHHANLKMQKPRKSGFKGDVILLTNGRTFSVSSEFVAAVKSLKRAVIVGEESGGTYEGNNSGTFAFVSLPQSHITLGIPMLAYYMEVDPIQRNDTGVMPDYTVKPSVADLISGTDHVAKFASDLAQKPLIQKD